MCLSWLSSLLCHTGPGTFQSMPFQSPLKTAVYKGLHTSAVTGENLIFYYTQEWLLFHLGYDSCTSVSLCNFLDSGLTSCLKIVSLLDGMLVHLKRELSVNFQVCLSAYSNTLSKVVMSAMLRTWGIPWKISSISSWSMLPTGVTPNSSCIYLYLPNGQEKVVKYDDCSSNFRSW